ncbi:ABC transporter D family member 1 [Camellia lanceoleosa]|uniref:ABC transporter D family member 1 n=1 Tax=Camellia lanceoleosa TaxID=1840588 RepID=A0ACC0IUT6_9ERIC|nr:ABC transporter D family member 1 [Camellia lanceoleosa]
MVDLCFSSDLFINLVNAMTNPKLTDNGNRIMDETDQAIERSKKLIAASPPVNHDVPLPLVPQLQTAPRLLPLRIAAMFKILVPTVLDEQGAQLLAIAILVISRTWISDRIVSLNRTTVKYVLEQDKAAFTRLIGGSILQSVASSFVAPSLDYNPPLSSPSKQTHPERFLNFQPNYIT